MEHITHAMREKYWAGIIKECCESGMKKCDWIKQHNINPKLYYRWQKRLRMEAGTNLVLAENQTQAIEIAELKKPDSVNDKHAAVITKNGISIEVNDGISDQLLIRLMKAMSNV
jgi:transposase-like protein